MKVSFKITLLVGLVSLAVWSVAFADTANQRKILEERVATVAVQVDQHQIRVSAQARWTQIGSPTPAAEFYDLKVALNRLSIEQALCTNSLSLDYGAKEIPTLAVPTVMPTRTPVPRPAPQAKPTVK